MSTADADDLLRLLAVDSEPLALYAALHLAGVESPAVLAAVEARLETAGSELAAALLDRLEELEGEASAADRLSRVLAVGSSEAQVQALGRWRDEVGEALDQVIEDRLEATGGEAGEAEDPHVLATLIGSLSFQPGGLSEALSAHVRAGLEHPEPRVRANAAELAGARAAGEFQAALAGLLEDAVPRVRAAAAQGLWDLDSGAVEARIEADLEVSDPRSILAALYVLGRLKEFPKRRTRLLDFSRHLNAQVRLMALRGLRFDVDELYGAELAEQFLAESSAACRSAIVELARSPHGEVFRDALALVLAEDEDPKRRSLAARGIAALGDAAAALVLAPYITDSDDRVRADVVEGLGEVEDPSVMPLLDHALTDPAPRVAANAALALWRRGGEDVVARLLLWLREEDAHRAASAAFALGEIGSEQVVGPLLEAAERLREEGAGSFRERGLLKQILKAIGKVRGT